MTIKTALSALAIAGLIAGGASAGTNISPKVDAGGGKGLVVVDISNLDVAENIANDLSVELNDTVDAADVADIGSVQLPITLAAAVCNIDVNAIASSNDKGDKSCAAESTSDALNQAVMQSMNTQ